MGVLDFCRRVVRRKVYHFHVLCFPIRDETSNEFRRAAPRASNCMLPTPLYTRLQWTLDKTDTISAPKSHLKTHLFKPTNFQQLLANNWHIAYCRSRSLQAPLQWFQPRCGMHLINRRVIIIIIDYFITLREIWQEEEVSDDNGYDGRRHGSTTVTPAANAFRHHRHHHHQHFQQQQPQLSTQLQKCGQPQLSSLSILAGARCGSPG